MAESRDPVKMGRGYLMARGNKYVSEFMNDFVSADTSAPVPLVRKIIDSMTTEAFEFQVYSTRELKKLEEQVVFLAQENKELKKKLESKQLDDCVECKHKREVEHPPSRGKGSAAGSSGNNIGSGVGIPSDTESVMVLGGDPSSESPSGLNPWTPSSVEDNHAETFHYKPGALLKAIKEINQMIIEMSAGLAIVNAERYIAEARVGLPAEILDRAIRELESQGGTDWLVYARVRYWKGRAHFETGEYQVALDSFQKAFEKGLGPNCGLREGKELASWVGKVKRKLSGM